MNREPFNHQTVKPHTFVPVLRIFTTVESPLQIAPFMQNKPNLRKSQMNVTSLITVDYENKSNWTLGENEPNTNPIQTQSPSAIRNTQYEIRDTNPIKPNPPALF